jgi:hypothetical protein
MSKEDPHWLSKQLTDAAEDPHLVMIIRDMETKIETQRKTIEALRPRAVAFDGFAEAVRLVVHGEPKGEA